MKSTRPLTVSHARMLATATHGHSRSCKRPLDSCETCRATIAWFASLPLDMLALVLEDRPKERRH